MTCERCGLKTPVGHPAPGDCLPALKMTLRHARHERGDAIKDVSEQRARAADWQARESQARAELAEAKRELKRLQSVVRRVRERAVAITAIVGIGKDEECRED